MKDKFYFHAVLLLFIFSTFEGCKKHTNSGNPIDQLPPETQTGANTFGCLINGEVFLPKGRLLSDSILKCAY